MSYIMVRPMNWDIWENVFKKDDVIGFGWSDHDFSQKNVEDLVKEIDNRYFSGQGKGDPAISKKLNQIRTFKNIKDGDIILVPIPYSGIVIAKAKTDEIYSPQHHGKDVANQRKVEYFRDENGDIIILPRNCLTQNLQKKLSIPGSSNRRLDEFEEEIRALLEHGELAWIMSLENEKQKKYEEFKIELLKHIQQGLINIAAHGRGLEDLITGILVAEGYTIDSGYTFNPGADVDLCVIKKSIFNTDEKYFIQIKNHMGTSDETGINQLIKGIQSKSDYSEYNGVFITTADSVTDTAKKLAAKNNITIIDGKTLVEIIIKSLDKISDDTKIKLGIYTTPRLFTY